MKDVVIIGAGASGLAAAIAAARRGKKVCLIEKNDKCGKKLLITGNGKCNYWNDEINADKYHSYNEELIEKVINEKNKKMVSDFFDSLGIVPKIKNGYYYPFSGQAVTIKNALTYECVKSNVEILYEFNVKEIKRDKNFIISDGKSNIIAKQLVIATGSKAASKTGSDGFGYNFASNFNHTVIEPLPALVQLRGEGDYFKKWSGIRTEAVISLYEDDKFIKKEKGEIQLTDYGISGIPTFNLSIYASKGLSKHKEKILINFIPFVKESAYKWLTEQKKLDYPISETLERVLNYKLVNIIIKRSNIKTNSFKKLSNDEFKTLVNNLINFEVPIIGTNSFEKAQTCIGGVPLNEINLNTMESKKVKNLYLIGEILDIAGDCGGYNLAFAWISGLLAGENI